MFHVVCSKDVAVKDGRDVTGKSKDRQKGEVERTDRDRKSEQHGRDKKHADGTKDAKQEERDEKPRSAAEKTRVGDDRTKDRGHRSDLDRSEAVDRTRATDRDLDAHQSSSGDATPGSHHSSEGPRRSADSAKQPDERGTDNS